MTREENLLIQLSEECNETAQRVSKALRFGLDEIQEGQPLTNAERIIQEFNDLVAVMEMLQAENPESFGPEIIKRDLIDKKTSQVNKWLKYSQKLKITE